MKRKRNLSAAVLPASTSVKVDAEDSAAINKQGRALETAVTMLGVARERALAEESVLLRQIAEARAGLTNLIDAIGKRRGVDVESKKWQFNLESQTFEKLST